jgi:hypothetical protein
MTGLSSTTQDGSPEMKSGQVTVGGLVEPEGQPTPLLDPIDTPFHRVALLVEIRIMADRPGLKIRTPYRL